ncbi:MAG TPA: hypothetical protein ACQGQH_00815 [Xylella sp.]
MCRDARQRGCPDVLLLCSVLAVLVLSQRGAVLARIQPFPAVLLESADRPPYHAPGIDGDISDMALRKDTETDAVSCPIYTAYRPSVAVDTEGPDINDQHVFT